MDHIGPYRTTHCAGEWSAAAAATSLVPADLQYAPTEGLEEVRAWVADHLRAAGRDLGPDDVLITSGSQQALSLVATALVDPGDRVAIEEPGTSGRSRR